MVAIFVVLMFVGFILVDLIVQKLEARRAAASSQPAGRATVEAGTLAGAPWAPWAVPDGIRISEGHAWFRRDSEGNFVAGADVLIAHALGAVTRVVLPPVGKRVQAGDALALLERDGRAVTLASPTTGRVIAVNRRLDDQPSFVAEAPYDNGWICALAPECPQAEIENAPWGEAAAAWLRGEFERFREFISARVAPDMALGFTSQDGGAPAPGALAQLDAAVWSVFEREFLRRR